MKRGETYSACADYIFFWIKKKNRNRTIWQRDGIFESGNYVSKLICVFTASMLSQVSESRSFYGWVRFHCMCTSYFVDPFYLLMDTSVVSASEHRCTGIWIPAFKSSEYKCRSRFAGFIWRLSFHLMKSCHSGLPVLPQRQHHSIFPFYICTWIPVSPHPWPAYVFFCFAFNDSSPNRF